MIKKQFYFGGTTKKNHLLLTASLTSKGRMYRGGSWNNDARNARSANRNGFGPGYRRHDLGFRPALSSPRDKIPD